MAPFTWAYTVGLCFQGGQECARGRAFPLHAPSPQFHPCPCMVMFTQSCSSILWPRLEKTDLAMSCWHYKEALVEDPNHKQARERLAVVRELYKKEVCPPATVHPSPINRGPLISSSLPPSLHTCTADFISWLSCDGNSCCNVTPLV